MTRAAVGILAWCALTLSLAARQPTPRFEVASVKPLPAGSPLAGYRPEPTRFSGYFSFIEAVAFAYQIEHQRIVDVPDWARDARYEINATTGPRKPGDINHMMRSLLEERFALKVRRERRPIPVVAMTMSRSDARPGPGLQRVERNCTPPVAASSRCGFAFGVGRYRATGQEWGAFVTVFETNIVRRPVVDRTGLAGRFDITLEWNPDIARVPEIVVNAPTLAELEARPILFTAVQEQLGLKLETDTALIDVLVIDSVRPPTPD
jgi:uncharacterized protein (TIGR03435 family)